MVDGKKFAAISMNAAGHSNVLNADWSLELVPRKCSHTLFKGCQHCDMALCIVVSRHSHSPFSQQGKTNTDRYTLVCGATRHGCDMSCCYRCHIVCQRSSWSPIADGHSHNQPKIKKKKKQGTKTRTIRNAQQSASSSSTPASTTSSGERTL